MCQPDPFTFSCPMKICCGTLALAHLPAELAAVNARSPMILAGRSGSRKMRHLLDAFRGSGMTLGVFDRLTEMPNPQEIPVLARLYRDGGCDSLLALGGAGVMDTAKCLNLFVSTQDSTTGASDHPAGGDPGRLRPLIYIPTAGGNGDETTGYASDGERRYASPRLIPQVAVIDPVMMDEPDDTVIADGALIALVQAVEAFLDGSAGPMGRAWAQTAIGLAVQTLPRVLGRKNRQGDLSILVSAQAMAGCAYFAAAPGLCKPLATAVRQWVALPLGHLMAMWVLHLVNEAITNQPERVGPLLHPLVGCDRFSMIAEPWKPQRTLAVLGEFFHTLNAGLDPRIPQGLDEVGLTDDQIDQVKIRVGGSGGVGEHLAQMIDQARKNPFLAHG